jgi:hypothetical protein
MSDEDKAIARLAGRIREISAACLLSTMQTLTLLYRIFLSIATVVGVCALLVICTSLEDWFVGGGGDLIYNYFKTLYQGLSLK